MSKERTEIKNALRALNVAEPLRIPGRLGFTAPAKVSAPTPLEDMSDSNTRGNRVKF